MQKILSLIAILAILSSCDKQNSEDKRPNIILIMSDDMGYSDLGCYGGEISTPNLDQLAKNGLRFTQFYNAARCCPTRASLMTGLYPHQAGIGHMTNTPENPSSHDYGLPGYQGFLKSNTNTIAEVLKPAGYQTYMAGKWHLGMQDSTMWPLQRGFEKFYGILAGATNYFKPEGQRGITSQNDQIEITDPDYYTTDAFTTTAIGFIDQGIRNEKPFFLYLAYNAPHWPLNAPADLIEKYKGKYLSGWANLRRERYQRMLDMGLVDKNWMISEDDAPDWDSLADTLKQEMDLRMAIYAAQIESMDQNIGRLTSYLKSREIFDETIIVFINDNGACAEGGTFGGGNKKILETEGGYFLTYGRSWANASNTPYREYKHYVHEGGISSPLIVSWPDGIDKQKNGSLVRTQCFLPDIMATFTDLAGGTYHLDQNGITIPQMAGVSLVPLISGAEINADRPIFWEHEGNKAIRLGDFKLVSKWNYNGPQKWELYNIKEDRTELNDLSELIPDKVAELSTLWDDWAASHQVAPWSEILEIQKARRN
ncbi:MAG: arylsulfatase [Bacteroidota bacterium]